MILRAKPLPLSRVQVADFGLSRSLRRMMTSLKNHPGDPMLSAPKILSKLNLSEFNAIWYDYLSVGIRITPFRMLARHHQDDHLHFLGCWDTELNLHWPLANWEGEYRKVSDLFCKDLRRLKDESRKRKFLKPPFKFSKLRVLTANVFFQKDLEFSELSWLEGNQEKVQENQQMSQARDCTPKSQQTPSGLQWYQRNTFRSKVMKMGSY